MDATFNEMLDGLVRLTFRDALKAAVKDPRLAGFFLGTLKSQKKAAALRQQWEAKGVHVPPLMILSVTERCNLHCAGCYSQGLRSTPKPEMGPERMEKLFTEASELGLSIVLLAGGEPLMKPELLDVTAKYPKTIFPLLTNGYLLDDAVIARLKGQRHVIPMLSMEGFETETDLRRGAGTYAHVCKAMERLHAAGIFFGVSITVTRLNYGMVTGDAFVRQLLDSGCRAFFYVEYSPVRPGTENMVPTHEQRLGLDMEQFRSKYPAVFLSFPGDEKKFGGCLSAGRGFIHVSASGDLEPCPFAPYSDASLTHMSLKEALQSEFLRRIRENSGELLETDGGCAIWKKREWAQALLVQSNGKGPAK
jgi:MoaA/NifB/PqqE/SkfB family radical SAM enzyme